LEKYWTNIKQMLRDFPDYTDATPSLHLVIFVADILNLLYSAAVKNAKYEEGRPN